MKVVNAIKLYNYLQCKHRVWRDEHGDETKKDAVNPFVELLWEKGVTHEDTVISSLGELSDLRPGSLDERFEHTLDAMRSGVPLIYQGVLK